MLRNLTLLALSLLSLPFMGSATVHTVLADNFFYAPSSITITEGDTVRFQWVAGNHPTSSTTGDWSSPVSFPLDAGNTSFDLAFASAGTYDYQCDFHVFLGMVGTVTVNAGGAPCTDAPMGLTSVSSPTGTNLSWSPVASALKCRIIGTSTSTGASGALIVNVPPHSAFVPCAFLTPGETYDWTVQCACNLAPVVATPVSATEQFTSACPTASEKVLGLDQPFAVYPNPAQEDLWYRFRAEQEGILEVQLLDLNGRLMERHEEYVVIGQDLIARFQVADYPAGTYVLQSRIGSEQMSYNVQVTH